MCWNDTHAYKYIFMEYIGLNLPLIMNKDFRDILRAVSMGASAEHINKDE